MQIISLERAVKLGLDTVHVFTQDCFGDSIMFGAAARALVRQTGRPVLIGTKSGNYGLLRGIDDDLPAPIYILDGYYGRMVNTANVKKLARRGIKLNYFGQSWTEKILPEIAVAMGFSGTVDLPLYVRADESLSVSDKPYITIMTGGRVARKAMPIGLLQSIIKKYKGKYNFVQLGTDDDQLLSDVIDMRGKLSLDSEIPTVIKNSALFIGSEGLLMHIAAATQTRAVIGDGWMGRLTGNAGHIHIFPKKLLPVMRKEDSPGDMETLDEKEFMNAIAIQLKEQGKPFPKNMIDLDGATANRRRIKHDSMTVNIIDLLWRSAAGILRGRGLPHERINAVKYKIKYGLSA